MNMMAYGYDADGYYHPDDFDPNTTYYGYFEPTSQYTYSVSGEFDRDASGDWNGNFLNWLTMRRVDLARKVLVGGLATSRTGGGNQKLYGETPAQESRKYFKFYANSGNYTAYDNNHLYKISKGDIEVYSIDTPSNFDYTADYKMYCNAYNGHDALCEDVIFWYNGNYSQDGQSYDIYPRLATEEHGDCLYSKYDTTSSLTGLTYVTSYNIKVDKEESEDPDAFLDGNIVGVLDRIVDRESARFGLEFFNNAGEKTELGTGQDGGYISAPITKKLKDAEIAKDMITDIQNTSCNTWTPLAEAFFVGVHYYRQDYDPYPEGSNFSINDQNDPFNYDKYGGKIECGKNFILLITDGESTMDENIPADYDNDGIDESDYDSDGNDPGSYTDRGSDYIDDIALWAHTNDMRSDLLDDQEIITYVVFAFGSGSQLLKDAAKNGGFIDKNDNNVPDMDSEWDEDGDGIPDTYFEAPDGSELEAQIYAAITDILQRAASGTAVSILSTSAEGEGSLFQAFFKPLVFDNLREIYWVGYLNSLWVDPYGNLREDTVLDHALVYSEDKIIKFTVDEGSGDTAIARYHDTDPCDGMPDSETPYETVLLSELDPQWEAGLKLAKRDASTRVIKTWVDIDGNGVVNTGEYINFDTSNASTLRPFLDVATETEAVNIISFIRGESVTGYRDRNITIEGTEYVWKLGDIVYSTPTVVGEPMERYNQYYSDITYGQFFTKWKDRGVTVYVGANDGMLHAFKAGTFHEGDSESTLLKEEHGWYSATEVPATTGQELGDERWAYIPYNLLPHLKWLTDPDYTHVYYVDLKPKVTDARIFANDANHPNGWGTILIGGMRQGGGEYTFTEDFDGNGSTEERTFRSAYFALDITIPDSPVFLGEFTDENLGFTTSYPAIARLEVTEGFQNPEDDHWFCIMGSGPVDCNGNSDQNGYVFIVDISNGGQLVKTFQTGETNAFMASPITLDLNLNYNTDVIYIGETYEQGSTMVGKMYRISSRTGSSGWTYQLDPNNWVMTTLFSSTTPITASATASIDEDDNIWVYFGTGKYYSNEDKADTTTQYFYGVKDPCPYGGCTAADEVALADLYNSTNIIILTNGGVEGATALTWDAFVDEVQAEEGWYLSLATGGERVLNRPSVLGGVVLFAPFAPDDDICAYGGTGSLYALYYETGTAYYEDILGTETYGDNEKSIKRISLDKGITSEIGLHVGQKATSTGFIQQGTGLVTQVEVDPALGIKSGIVGWKQY
ncbi:MAG: hypothetical protein AMJ42_04650 [Deltaproteobacteria bacterium DG_8]|nr:MAG: hypothetical protein AMJ42_04650 [Deltaproteobacteria bacterium DG_8]